MQPGTTVKVLLITGTIVGVIAVVMMASFPAIYNSIVDSALQLKPNGPIMESFTIPPVPIYMSFYFFNVTNPRDVLYYGKKPKLNQVGPYVYEEFREKFDMEFSGDKKYLNYRNNFIYKFRQDKSGDLTEQDLMTTINIIFVTLAVLGHDLNNTRLIWPEMERTMDVFETHTVGEFLFEGWELPEFNFNFAESGINGTQNLTYDGTLGEILQQIGVEDIPEALQTNRLGYFSLVNNTNDGYYKVNTGKESMAKYLKIEEWNNETSLDWWNDKYCDMINGTDGTQFPPRSIDKNTTVFIFVTQLCRSLYLTYDTVIDLHGVKALRFRPPAEMLQSPTLNKANECYGNSGLFGYLPSGFLEMTPCLQIEDGPKGIPLVMSTPHFYNGDPAEVAKFEGLEPNRDLHDTILDIQTTFGIPVSAHKRIQLNLPLKKYANLTSFMNLKGLTLFPVFWVDETAEISESDANDLNKALELPYTIWYVIFGVLLAIAAVLAVIGYRKKQQLEAVV